MSWKTAKEVVISTPAGDYTPKSDNLIQEVMGAAEYARLKNFNLRINGKYYDEDELPVNSIAALTKPITIEGVEAPVEKVEVEARDNAG